MPIACPFRQKAERLWMERKVIRKPDPGKCKAVWDALLQISHTCFRTLRQGDGLIRYTKRINIATLVLRPSCLAKPASGICSRCGRRFPRFACGLAKNLPCALRLRGIFRQNLVRPNLYTEKPLKRNDRYDRKTHKKMSAKRAADKKLTHSTLKSASNKKNNSHETDKDYQNSITYSCRRFVCLSAVGGVFHRRNDQSLTCGLS